IEERSKQAEIISWIGEASFGLAHRLGNDLGTIPSRLNDVEDALEREGFSQLEVTEGLAAIKKAARKDLDLSYKLRAEVSAFRPDDPTVFPVSALVAAIQEMFRDKFSSKFQLVIDVREDIGPIRAVHRHAEDILRNLVTNALEAMPTGGR